MSHKEPQKQGKTLLDGAQIFSNNSVATEVQNHERIQSLLDIKNVSRFINDE